MCSPCRVPFQRAVEQSVEQQSVRPTRLCSELRTETDQDCSTQTDRDIDDRGSSSDVFRTVEPPRKQLIREWVLRDDLGFAPHLKSRRRDEHRCRLALETPPDWMVAV